MRISPWALCLMLAFSSFSMLGASVRSTISSGDGGGGGGGTTLPAQSIFTSEASPLKVCGLGALTDDCYHIYTHSNGTPTVACVINGVEGNCDIDVKIDSGNTWCIRDHDDNIVTCLQPSATGRFKYIFGNNYRLRKSILLFADSFYMHGCTLFTDSPLVAGGIVEPYITCGDNDAHGFHRTLAMPRAWAADAVVVTQYAINANATPANLYQIDYSAECESNSDVMGASISSTGEQPASINFSNTGSCGTTCAQNDVTIVSTASVTPNGTCSGGSVFRLQGNLNAAGTTTGQVADVKIFLVTVEFSLASWGE